MNELVIFIAGLASGIVVTVLMVKVIADEKVMEIERRWPYIDPEGEIIKIESISSTGEDGDLPIYVHNKGIKYDDEA